MLLILLLLVFPPVPAAQQSADATLQADIQRKVAALKLRSAKVVVTVHDHVAVVDGMVRTLWDKLQIIEAARKTKGIERVDSTLEVARGESDSRVAAAVSNVLQRYPRMSIYDYVDGDVRNGRVTLTGAVTNEVKSFELAEEIEKTSGVLDLDNRIRTLPVSPSDDEIRVRIGTAIFTDPFFSNYSASSPPIHIVVENGHVTLVGVLSAQIERQKVEAVARGTPGVFSVDDKIKLTSELRQ